MNAPISHGDKSIRAALRTRSLRFWVGFCLLTALLPLAVSAVGGYLLLQGGVIAPFQDVASRQREQIVPAQHLRLLIWDTVNPVDEYVQDANPVHTEAYRLLRVKIESGFVDVIEALSSEPESQELVKRARDSWTAADGYATALVSVSGASERAGATETMQKFHGEIVAASDKLAAVYELVSGAIREDHDTAIRFYERAMWLAGIAGGVSLLSVVFGVMLIGRVISGSVDRLVQGAERFAEGDRDHRIEVQVPPELHRVAEEFNYMIGRIKESETALADMALHDSLTGLPNRRAFDSAFSDIWARYQRFREPAALLAIDIDHFKQVNDRHGHAAGDEVLRVVAGVMGRSLRPFDKVFRVGGEEFNLILPNTDLVEAHKAAERLRLAIAAVTVAWKGSVIAPTVSIGLAAFTPGRDQNALLAAADAALYDAKSSGRNRVVSDDAGQSKVAL